MFRPDYEYKCLLGIYDPLGKQFHPDYLIDDTFTAVATRPSDQNGAIGSTDVFTFTDDNSPKALLIARPFREHGSVVCEHIVNGSAVVDVYSLYSSTLETPRLIWLPSSIRRVVFNIAVEDMGYEPSWYDQNQPITEACDRDFINQLGLFFMYDSSPYYSRLDLSKERDSQAASGRFLRDKVATDLTFRGKDFDRLTEPYDYQLGTGVSEYAVCSVVFYEMFEEQPQQDYMAACLYFNRADAEISFSECYVKPDLKALDNYSWLLDKYTVEKNIVGIQANTETVLITIPPVMQFYITGADTLTNVCNDSCWEQEVSDPDISVNKLRQMGFMKISGSMLPNSLTTDRALNIVLTDEPMFQIFSEHRIIYALNMATGEYSFETTQNWDNEPTDAFPYDKYRFRLRNGNVECYNYENGAIVGSKPYSGQWPPFQNEFATDPRDYMKVDGKWWGAYSANIDANVNVYARILCHSDSESDLYAIGNFASLSKWYNKLAYPVDTVVEHTLPWEEHLLLRESNQLTYRPTEYGHYDPDRYYTNEGLQLSSYLSGVKPIPIVKSWWGDYSYWLDIVGVDTESWLSSYTATTKVNDCYTLDSVIRRLLNSYGLSFDFTNTYKNSRLIYGETSGHIHFPAQLKCRCVYLIPATNVTRGKYTQAAQKSMLSLKDLLDEVCSMCNAGWHVDKDGLHIEGNDWYDHGKSYVGIYYDPSFDFESVVDEFNDTNTLYGQIANTPNTSGLWHTLSLGADENATKHFGNTEMAAKAVYCKNESSVSPRFTYDLLEALARNSEVSEDGIVCLASNKQISKLEHINGQLILKHYEASTIDATTIYEVGVGSQPSPVQARIMNRAFSWPYIKGRRMFELPVDKSLVDFGWLQAAEYLTTMSYAYTASHRSIKIRMPVVSALYTRNWQLVKTTLGYGVVSNISIDMISRVANVTVDILEYNL